MGERDRLEVTGADGKIILRCVFRKWNEGMDWIDLAQARDRWRACVKVVMDLRVPLAENPLAC
jgi:hypothetical protein